MAAEFLQRVRKELTLTLTGLHESVLAVSERVNRKVQTLKLHWKAATISRQIDDLHREAGTVLADRLAPDVTPAQADQDPSPTLAAASSRLRLLKGELAQVEALIRELEAESLQEELLLLQRDLFTRSATIERIAVPQGSPVVGQPAGHLGLPPDVRLVAVLRGPALLTAAESVVLRTGDIVVLLGPRGEMPAARSLFSEKQRIRA
ncbi:MAG: TrkA C-terminal domain-containing protein [Nitrospirota bacterium]